MTKTFIVAEIGVNHNGDCDQAAKLIDFAVEAGVDAVKFQLWQLETFPQLEDLRLSAAGLMSLKTYARGKGLEWFCTPFDLRSAELLAEYFAMDIWKLPSNKTVWQNQKLIDFVFNQVRWGGKKKLFISMGYLSKLADIYVLTCRTKDEWKESNVDLTFMHCVSKYPTPCEESNLLRVFQLFKYFSDYRHKFNKHPAVGLSDHSGLPEIPVAAVALGASVIECHLTEDKNQEGPDHKASLNPEEFASMVKMVRNVEKAIRS